MGFNEFEEYKKQGEPTKKQKAENWAIAIGLQKVDDLTPSKYLIETAKENIEGKIESKEVRERINSYYKTEEGKKQSLGTEQADKVSMHIAEILSEASFTFSPATLFSIHRRIFSDVFPKIAGKIRDYNITKEEKILLGDTVYYGSFQDIKETLDYDFDREKKFSYTDLSLKDKIEHVAEFISGIWQIHPFAEGNTRTVAIFTIKYLRTIGFDINNDFFEQNAKYFRDSLVRANYQDLKRGIQYTKEYLNKFFENMLFEGKNELDSKYLIIPVDENPKNVGVNQKNVGVNEKNVGVNEKNVGVKTADRVLFLIKDNNKITINEISERLGKTTRSIERAIQRLKKDNRIERIGSDKTGVWKIL